MPRAARVRGLALAAALAGTALLVAGCVASASERAFRPVPKKPQLPTVRDFALVSTLGEESGIKITAIDNVPVEQMSVTGRRPADAPPNMHKGLGVWLTPGIHLIHVQYARNIESGISFTQGNLRVTVVAGHTYIVRPRVASDFGEVSLSLVDHGAIFPVRCLPGVISQTQALDARGRRSEFTLADILACRQRPPP